MHAVRFPLRFNAEALAADLKKVQPEEWLSHYRNDEYEGEWAVAALRSVGGHPAVVHAVPANASIPDFFKSTPLLERCPAFQEVLQHFQCPVGVVRLMRLGAGAKILEHSDNMGDEVRLHVPVQTNEQIRFYIDHQLVPMMPGELWYGDFTLPHRVENNGDTDRVHIVLDCARNEWLDKQLQQAYALERITDFLKKLDIPVQVARLGDDTFLPGILIQDGGLLYDPDKICSPGDLLHEAGHIAVAEHPEQLNGNVGEADPNAMGNEIATILWSYAALKAIGDLPDEMLFHPEGYKGGSEWHLKNYRSGNYIGVNLLEWMGMCATPEKAAELGIPPYPHMIKWRFNTPRSTT